MTRRQKALTFGVLGATSTIAALAVGGLGVRFGLKRVVAATAALSGLLYLTVAASTSFSLFIVAFGAVLRLAMLASRWGDPLQLNDSIYYSAQARQLTEGRWFREVFVDHPGAEHGPLTSLVLAPMIWPF